jgi:hypothetical protein
VVAALTVPAELILVKAVSTDAQSAARDWVAELGPESLDLAAGEIQNYPYQYRREILSRLPANRRADVWVNHIVDYRDSRPELTSQQVDALNAAIEAAKATFAAPGPVTRAATRVVAERITELFGADTTDYLMHRLGNRNVLMLASATPWHMRLSDYVRDRFVVQADGAGDCWCSVDFGCDLLSMTWCDGAASCTLDETWPMCGWFWDEVCDGVCKTGAATN